MLNSETLFSDLDEMGLNSWREALAPLLLPRTADSAHGDVARWKDILRQLPAAKCETIASNEGIVVIGEGDIPIDETDRIRLLLQGLTPWRKGPFNIHGIELNAEWRCDMKWDRIRNSIESLEGRNILDVGCGNGYYAFRMKNAGAARIIGIDPTLLFVCQFTALKKMSAARFVHVLPLRLHELPMDSNAFDTTFSMGVLYHQRDPAAHLAQLRDTLRPGGELVLETLVLPGDEATVRVPDDRYARMRNVWHLPTIPALEAWLTEAGLVNISVADVSKTTVDEQRRTPWMPFDSLAESLDPHDISLTIEGWPAPIRAVLTCNTP